MNEKLKEWARKEIDLLIGDDLNNGEYESAYNCYCDIINRFDGDLNPGVIKTVLVQLLSGFPLTPIQDNDENEWEFLSGYYDTSDENSWSLYKNKRRSSLFKKIYNDGKSKIKYSDPERCVCIDVNTNEVYKGGMGFVILDEVFPIAMPYFPVGKIKIYTEELKAYKDDEADFDTIGVLYFRTPEGKMSEIMRFFKKEKDTKEFVEIDKHEYFARKDMAEKRR